MVRWPIETGLSAASCVRCFFDLRAVISRQSHRCERDFGVVPRIRGGLHGGAVTAGELGDTEQQIVFVGDIPNTAARLEEYAKRLRLDLITSEASMLGLALPFGV